MQAREETADPS